MFEDLKITWLFQIHLIKALQIPGYQAIEVAEIKPTILLRIRQKTDQVCKQQ